MGQTHKKEKLIRTASGKIIIQTTERQIKKYQYAVVAEPFVDGTGMREGGVTL